MRIHDLDSKLGSLISEVFKTRVKKILENIDKQDLINTISDRAREKLINYILESLHELVVKYKDRQSLAGYAFEISKQLGGMLTAREIEKLYKERYAEKPSIKEDGRIVKGVNTTVDIGPNEIKTQAAKYGNTVDKDGFPPKMTTAVKPKSTTVKHHKPVKESEEPRYTAAEWAIISGGHTLEEVKPKKRSDLFAQLENFADGKVKGKSRPGRVKRAGASCNGSVTDLRKRAKNSSGEKAKMYHWCANMKSGRKKK